MVEYASERRKFDTNIFRREQIRKKTFVARKLIQSNVFSSITNECLLELLQILGNKTIREMRIFVEDYKLNILNLGRQVLVYIKEKRYL